MIDGDGVEWLTQAEWQASGYFLIEGEKCGKRNLLGIALYSDSQVEADDLEEMLK